MERTEETEIDETRTRGGDEFKEVKEKERENDRRK